MSSNKLSISATAVLLATTFGTCGRPAQGKPQDGSCASAYESAQEFRKASKLQSAEEMLSVCARKSCGKFLHRECSVWLEQLRHEMPSVIFSVKGGTGAALNDVQVSVDGVPLPAAASGAAIAVDPGMREFRFDAKGHVVVSQQVEILRGQQNRSIEVRLAEHAKAGPLGKAVSNRPEQAADEHGPGGSSKSVVPYVVGGVGLLGVVSFGVLGTLAKKEHAEVRDCLPDCPRAKLARVSTLYAAANVSLGVGVVGLGTGAVLLLVTSPRSAETRNKPSDKAKLAAIDVRQTRGGVLAELRGSF